LEIKQFGKESTADLCDRMDKLDQFLKPKKPAADGYVVQDEDASSTNSGNKLGGKKDRVKPSEQANSTDITDGSTNNGNPYSDADYGSYPRVTELEQQFLGTTYVKDPLPERVTRLETKEFNKTWPDDALCDRIDRLDKRANPKSKKNSPASDNDSAGEDAGHSSIGSTIGKALMGLMGGGIGGPGLGTGMIGGMNGIGGMGMGPGLMSGLGGMHGAAERGNRNTQSTTSGPDSTGAASRNPFSQDAEPVVGTGPRISALEKFVFGREYTKSPTEERLQRLEKKLVPYEHHAANEDVARRVDRLWELLARANGQSKKPSAEH
jgi:hypothetical protein